MTSTTARLFLILTVLVSGLLAGLDVDRTLVAMPAWQQVGALAWAEFSRHADLGNGLVVYPIEAIGGALLTATAAVVLHRDRTAPRAAVLLLYIATLFAACGLALTLKAAPIMLGIRNAGDPNSLQQAFDGFRYWGDLRGLCQVLAFVSQLAALGLLCRSSKPRVA